MQEVKKIGVLSTAKICGLFGLVLGAISVILSKALCSSQGEIAMLAGLQCDSLTAGGIILGIISAGVIYFLAGVIGVAIYNLFANWIGGIQIELQEPKQKPKKAKKKK